MAYSKTFLLLGLLFAVVLVVSSEVSARELDESAETKHGGGCGWHGCGGGGGGCGRHGCGGGGGWHGGGGHGGAVKTETGNK